MSTRTSPLEDATRGTILDEYVRTDDPFWLGIRSSLVGFVGFGPGPDTSPQFLGTGFVIGTDAERLLARYENSPYWRVGTCRYANGFEFERSSARSRDDGPWALACIDPPNYSRRQGALPRRRKHGPQGPQFHNHHSIVDIVCDDSHNWKPPPKSQWGVLRGQVRYRDGFGNPRKTNFCHRYNSEALRSDNTIPEDHARYHEHGNAGDSKIERQMLPLASARVVVPMVHRQRCRRLLEAFALHAAACPACCLDAPIQKIPTEGGSPKPQKHRLTNMCYGLPSDLRRVDAEARCGLRPRLHGYPEYRRPASRAGSLGRA
jgi:hypothetical protein